MANGAFNFKDSNGNIVSFISGSGPDIIMSGGTLNLSSMTGLTLGNLTMEGTVETASFAPNYLLTSSFESYTGTTDTIIGDLQISTSSLNSFTSSATTRLNLIEGKTGSYATTGSNQFDGSQSITGSLTVTGDIIAQTLNVQQVTSSVVYSSGSNVFGNNLSNTHQFTGSLSVTGSLALNGLSAITGTGTRTENFVPKFGSGGNTIQNSAIFESGGNVGINTTSFFGFKLEVKAPLPALFYNDSTANSPTYGGTIFYRPTSTLNNGVGISFNLNNSIGNLTEYGYIGALIESNTEASNNGAIIFAPTSSESRIERMRITSGGNVGIGTNNPDFYSFGTSGKYITLQNTSGFSIIKLVSNETNPSGISFGNATIRRASIDVLNGSVIEFNTNPTNSGNIVATRMRITSGGNVLINKTNDEGFRLDVNGTGRIGTLTMGSGFSSYTPDGLFSANAEPSSVNTPGGNKIRFGYWDGGAGQYYGRIGFAGSANWSIGMASDNTSLLITTGNPGALDKGLELSSTGTARFSGTIISPFLSGENTTSGSAVIQGWNKATSGDNKFIEFYTEGGGGILRGSIDYNRAGGAVRYNTTSDANLKNIIGDSDKQKSIDILNSTKIKEYSWKDDKTNKIQIGVIAQELYETFKGAVSKGSDDKDFGTEDYKEWAVDKTAFTFHLIAGWQKHQEIINNLQTQIETLKTENKTLTMEIQSIKDSLK